MKSPFQLNKNIIHLNHAAIAPWPVVTCDEVIRFAKENMAIGSQNYEIWLQTEQQLKEKLKQLINAQSSDEIAILKNTSEGLSLIAQGLSFQAGDNIVVPATITLTQKGDTKMNYIGVDCHITSLDFAVVNEKGHTTRRAKVETSVKEFMQFVKNIPKPRRIFIEEGELASWLLETSLTFGEELIITDPKTNKWIGKSGQKDDAIDAEKLAQLARGRYIKEIYHPVNNRRRFKELVYAYHDTVKSQTRIKNKIKAKFRREGIRCSGDTVYSVKYREEWRKKLPGNKIVHLIVNELWSQLDQIQNAKEGLTRDIRIHGKQYPEIKRFRNVPGIGLIHASTLSAIIETPHRFANKKKLWMYAGIGLAERKSGETVYSRRLT